MVHDFPADDRLKYNLAQACDNLGTLYRTHPGGSVVDLYERSLNLLRELHRDRPDRVHFAVSLAETCSNLGSVYWGNNLPDKAAAVYKEGLGILEPLVGAHPGHVWYASTLASLRINLGSLLSTQGRGTEALQQFDMALEALQQISCQFVEIWLIRSASSAFITHPSREGCRVHLLTSFRAVQGVCPI